MTSFALEKKIMQIRLRVDWVNPWLIINWNRSLYFARLARSRCCFNFVGNTFSGLLNDKVHAERNKIPSTVAFFDIKNIFQTPCLAKISVIRARYFRSRSPSREYAASWTRVKEATHDLLLKTNLLFEIENLHCKLERLSSPSLNERNQVTTISSNRRCTKLKATRTFSLESKETKVFKQINCWHKQIRSKSLSTVQQSKGKRAVPLMWGVLSVLRNTLFLPI